MLITITFSRTFDASDSYLISEKYKKGIWLGKIEWGNWRFRLPGCDIYFIDINFACCLIFFNMQNYYKHRTSEKFNFMFMLEKSNLPFFVQDYNLSRYVQRGKYLFMI